MKNIQKLIFAALLISPLTTFGGDIYDRHIAEIDREIDNIARESEAEDRRQEASEHAEQINERLDAIQYEQAIQRDNANWRDFNDRRR